MTEVWIAELGQWVLMDAMNDWTYFVDSRPASLVNVYDAIKKGRTISLEQGGKPVSIAAPQSMHRMFRHLYVSTTNALFEGYQVCFACDKRVRFAHFTSSNSPDYPETLKRVLLVAFLTGILLGTIFWLLFFLTLLRNPLQGLSPLKCCEQYKLEPGLSMDI